MFGFAPSTWKWSQEKISTLFYHHGLFCASHPFGVMSLVICIVLFTCYPLTRLPLPGNAPLQFTTPIEGYKIPPRIPPIPADGNDQAEEHRLPRWYLGPPVAYVQQIVIKATVSPWQQRQLIPTDAFRVPLKTVFAVLDDVNNFQFGDREHSVSVADYCLHVSETTQKKMPQGMLPEYGCLVVSPAYFWNKDVHKFTADGEIINTIYRDLRPPFSTPPSLRDILFGVVWKETGVKKFYLRNRQRVMSFAVTIVFKKYDPRFMAALRDKLQVAYPLSLTFNNSEVDHLVHVHYRAINHFVEYTPLMVSYVLLFLYIYFSVRKIEMVKSKWGLAFSAVVTVIASLLMSVSLCLSFGLTPSLNGSEIFPYLVVIIGLENVLVMTKSIVSTPIQLDVKLRVAQGLSKEGWHIFKNLMAELLILTVGFFTFVPAVQEFCLFAVVGLLSDFFLQILFFTTVLSIDIRRMELSDLQRQSVIHSSSSEVSMTTTVPSGGMMSCPVLTCLMAESAPHPPQAKLSNLRLTQRRTVNHSASYYQLPTPPPSPNALGRGDGRWDQPYVLKLPRRVRLWNFWARTRVAQRGIMACVVIWIALIVYKTGLVDHLTGTNTTQLDDLGGSTSNSHPSLKPFEKFSRSQDWMERKSEEKQQTGVDEKEAAKHGSALVAHHDMESWRHLSHTHWPKLLGFYNISLRGRYITILPSIHLSKLISPDDALAQRHPLEVKTAALFPKYSPVDTAGDKQRLTQAPNQSLSFLAIMRHRLTVYPRTNTEFILTLILGFASTILMTYALMMLYKCMCPRDYARWRSSWGHVRRRRKRNSLYFNQIQDAVPLVLAGHTQEVECIACDGPLIISSCLGGQLRVWDSSTGECRTVINRKTVVPPPPLTERNPVPGRNTDDSDADLYAEYHEHVVTETASSEGKVYLRLSDNIPPGPRQQSHSSSGSDDFTFSDIAPDLSSSISTNFSELDSAVGTPGKGETTGERRGVGAEGGYDFTSRFESYYREHRDTAAERAVYYERKRRLSTETPRKARRFTSEGYEDDVFHMERSRSSGYVQSGSSDESMPSVAATEAAAAAIWCLACQDSLIVAGCGNGRIEFWDGLTGHLKYLYQEGKAGVTAVCFVANRVIAARLSGDIDFLELETFQNVNSPATPTSVSRLYNRAGHFCRLSSGHVTESHDLRTWDDIIHVTLLSTTHAHQRPINLLQTEGGRVVSGGQDHTLKVYRLEDSLCLYTLHGHSGAITALHLDVMTPLAAASGAEDGTVRLWDLLTGACVHKLGDGHHGRVTALTCTLTHVVSAGLDNRLCIWERWNGHLLHWLHMSPGSCNSLSVLTNNLLVSGGQGCLFLWDISKGKVLRVIPLGETGCSVFIHQLCIVRNTAVVCDFGEQLQVVHFPTVLQKIE